MKATAAFKTLRPIWTSQVISVKTKLQIFNPNVKSALFYACDTWRITKALTHKVQTFINICLNAILHIKWQDKITNEEIWRRTGKHRQKPRSRGDIGIGWATPCENQCPAWYAKLCNETHNGNGREEDPAPHGEGLWKLKGRRWDTPGVSWKCCPETGPSGGSLWSTYAPHGVHGYKSINILT